MIVVVTMPAGGVIAMMDWLMRDNRMLVEKMVHPVRL